ncbi:U-scoloptoxin(05)-Sm1a isoform X2 [Vespula pensylvanica]|uniref:Protein sleepless n=1 Tax=Vespula pensylvanica TaxID=30213 RepID=A0A834JYR6_VESPE|nr:U-scoloptoxin(05)-Sm1a isoform X2 [Vespula pensylvanica]KAF7397164.1 hypothetical protein H0235_016701 [Vespula pensylvanica]
MAIKDIRKILTILVIFLIYIGTVHSIRCYQCTSTNNTHPFQCNEFLTNDIDIEPESCDAIFGAQYCVKHVGRFEGGVGTKRFCSTSHLGNYCNYVLQPGDKLTYRTCIYTCNSDGCNSISSLRPTVSVSIISFLLLTLFYR